MPCFGQYVKALNVSMVMLVAAHTLDIAMYQVILPLLALAPAVSWPWVPACGSLEPCGRDGENAQKAGDFGGKMGEIWSKKCRW